MIRWCFFLGLSALAMSGPAARAQDSGGRPVGPCSPVAGPGGGIPSEMPGCRRRHRPPDGSLADEMAFRRARGRAPDHPSWEEPAWDEPD